MVKPKQFYVYLHLRPDMTGVDSCFYVGKGTRKRSRDLSTRNPYHKNIVSKFGSQNIVVKRLPCPSESHALKLEAEMIAILRRMGTKLTNVTAGGESPTGYVPTEEAKARSSAITKKLWMTEDYRTKVMRGMALANADPDLQHQRAVTCREMATNPEYRAKRIKALKRYWETNIEKKEELAERMRLRFENQAIRAAYSEVAKAQWADPEFRKNSSEAKRQYFSKQENRAKASLAAKVRFQDPEQLAKITEANRLRGLNPEHRAKLSAIALARPPVSEETKRKMSASQKVAQRVRAEYVRASGTPRAPVTEETRKILSDKSKASWVIRKERGEIVSEGARAKMSLAAKSRQHKPHSQETKDKIKATKAAKQALIPEEVKQQKEQARRDRINENRRARRAAQKLLNP